MVFMKEAPLCYSPDLFLVKILFIMTDYGSWLLVSFVLLLSGCATQEHIFVGDSTGMDALNVQSKSASAKIVLLSSEVYWASSLEIAEDSTRFIGRRVSRSNEQKEYVIATDQIKRVRLQENALRTGRGMGVGAATGFVLGFSAAYLVSKGSGCPGASDGNNVLSACPDEIVGVGGILGLGGGLVGAIIGSAHSRIQVYHFQF